MSVGECQLSGYHSPCSYGGFLTHKVHRFHPCPHHVVPCSSGGLSRFRDCPYKLGQASSASLVREVRLSKGEAVSLASWLIGYELHRPAWLACDVTAVVWAHGWNAAKPTLVSDQLRSFMLWTFGIWKMRNVCVAQWMLSLTHVQQQKTVTQHLPTSPAVEVS